MELDSFTGPLVIWCPDCGKQYVNQIDDQKLVCECGYKGEDGWDTSPPVKWTFENQITGEKTPLVQLWTEECDGKIDLHIIDLDKKHTIYKDCSVIYPPGDSCAILSEEPYEFKNQSDKK